MTRLNPAFTSLKTLNITYQTPQETLLGTPETLPTSEPSTPQIGYTVQTSNLPAFSPYQPYKVAYVGLLIGAGKFTSSGTLYWRMKKNGVSVKTGQTSPSANTYYSVLAFFLNVNVGDLLELALWSTVSDSNWDYKAFAVQLTRLIVLNKPRLLMPCNFASLTTHPALTLGNPSYGTGSLYPIHCDAELASISAAKNYECLYAKDTYGMLRLNYGDYNYADAGTVRTHSSYRPFYYRNYVPTQIIMRGARID